MPTPLTTDDIFQKLSPCFHEHYRKLQQTHIQNSETIFFVCNCSINRFTADKNQSRTDIHWGYLVLTSHRRLLVGLAPSYPKADIVYYKRHVEGTAVEKVFGVRSDKRRWILPPYPVVLNPKATIFVVERQLLNVHAVVKSDFQIFNKGEEINIREFYFSDDRGRDWYAAVDMLDGKQIYDLHQSAIHNGGRLLAEEKTTISNIDDVPALLHKLSELHKAGILTDEEFTAKKQELLKRI